MGTNEEYVPIFEPSLPVPNVQEMVEKEPQIVPDRYLRSDEGMQKVTDTSDQCYEVPVIDLLLLVEEDEFELQKLDRACRDWGFFQVVNHGAAEEVLQKMKDRTVEFFNLPLEERNKFAMHPNDTHGYGHAYIVSEEQKLDWSDALMLVLYPLRLRNLKFWPFKDVVVMEAYANEIRRVGEKLMSSLSRVMGMEAGAILGLHKDLGQALRVNYYPTCCRPGQVLGVSPHSDTSSVSVLMQDDRLNGLQIRHDGKWVPVRPITNALVVNVGDVLEIWSNGKYKSVEHRAITNENERRISYATFFFPDFEADVEPLEHMLDSERPLGMYKKTKYGDYLRHSMKRALEGKAHTEIAKI